MCGGQRTTCRSLGSIFFLHYIGSGDLTQVVRLGSKHLYPLSHLAGPNFLSFRLCPCVNVYTGMPASGDFILKAWFNFKQWPYCIGCERPCTHMHKADPGMIILGPCAGLGL